MNKITIGIVIGIVLCALLSILAPTKTAEHEVVGKYEKDGKCYISVEVEISPEDYIGYDIGDNYHAIFNAQ